MSKVICVMGESGSGKTCSLRNLDPKQTFYFDADKKGLPWKNWKKDYNSENKNYKKTTSATEIMAFMKNISEKAEHIKHIVIDTLNGIMIDDEMRRANEKGYDKWTDLAISVWDLCSLSNELREDLTVILLAHSQTEMDENGYKFTRIKTSGRKIDKINLESKFNTVLFAKKTEDGYIFETNSNHSTAKSPFGAFESLVIENDMKIVIDALAEY